MSWTYFALLVLIALIVQGFFTMMEMACVSFNKVRLHYYRAKGYARARWLSNLLAHPGRFFGTTLIVVNTALQFGSECARQLYTSLGLDPDWSALSQVLVVLIFAELSPMFAARKHSEHVAMLGIPILVFASKVLTPIIWVLDLFVRGINRLFGVNLQSGLYLTRDELQKAVESKSESGELIEDFDTASSQIFSLKTRTAKELMQSLDAIEMLASDTPVKTIKTEFSLPCLPIFTKIERNVTGIIYPRDLLKAKPDDTIRPYAHAPWFIPENTTILELVSQFRTNNQALAVVLNLSGQAIGILTLDAIIDEIFGSLESSFPQADNDKFIIERTFPGDTLISTINDILHIQLPHDTNDTLNDLLRDKLDHPPTKDEIVRIDHFEIKVLETTLLGAKTVLLRSV